MSIGLDFGYTVLSDKGTVTKKKIVKLQTVYMFWVTGVKRVQTVNSPKTLRDIKDCRILRITGHTYALSM